MKSVYLITFLIIVGLSFVARAQNQPAIYDYWYVIEQENRLSIQMLDITTDVTHELINFALDPNAPLYRAMLSADRHWLAYVVGYVNDHDIYIVNLETGQQQIVLANITREDNFFHTIDGQTEIIAWSPENASLLIRTWNPDTSPNREFFIYDPLSGMLRQMQVSNPNLDSIDKVDWSDDSRLHVVKTVCSGQGLGCETVPAIWDANNLTEIASFSGNFSAYANEGICQIHWSPDERYIAYMAHCDSTAIDIEKEVYVYDTVADELRAITNFTDEISLQNLYVAVYSLTWADNDILLIGTAYRNASGVHTEILTYAPAPNSLIPQFEVGAEDWELAPDRQHIVYRAFTATDYYNRTYSVRIAYRNNLDNFHELSGIGCNFMWSSDSHWLAYTDHTDTCNAPVNEIRFTNADMSQSYVHIPPVASRIIPLGWVGTLQVSGAADAAEWVGHSVGGDSSSAGMSASNAEIKSGIFF
jgi:hypothetical protein